MKNTKRNERLPVMGWNSWDCYGAGINEQQLLENAKFMRDNLKQFGYEYVVCDIQWYEPTADSTNYHKFSPLCMDEFSRLIPAENRFPSSKNGVGFKKIADEIHSMGLKFGIHIMRGIPREAVHRSMKTKSGVLSRDIASFYSLCSWNNDMYGVDYKCEGAQEYYDSLFEMYSEWEIDFVKVDDICVTEFDKENPYSAKKEIEMIRKAIDKCPRDIVLSLSPGPADTKNAFHLSQNADMWRLTGDFWDEWDKLKNMFTVCERWYTHQNGQQSGRGDLDMIPFGNLNVNNPRQARKSNFTFDEEKTLLALWSMFRSPLILGCDLPTLDEKTLSLIQNEALIDIDQHSSENRPVYDDGSLVIWTCKLNSKTVLAFFNVSDEKREFNIKDIDLPIDNRQYVVYDIFSEKIDNNSLNNGILKLKKHSTRAVYLSII